MTIINIANMNETLIFKAMVEAYNKSEGHFGIALPDGKIADIKAFAYMPNHEDCEWFFVEGTSDPWADNDSLAKLAKYFANYEAKMTRLAKEKDELKQYEAKLASIEDKSSDEYRDMYSYYSDWHKDLYGFRPRCLI